MYLIDKETNLIPKFSNLLFMFYTVKLVLLIVK